jgi:small-conductance mechanosensitive channel
LTIAVNNTFRETGIQIPFPQQDVHVHWPDGVGVAARPAEPSKEGPPIKSGEASMLVQAKGPLAKN